MAQKHELEKQKLAAFQSSHGQYRKQQYSRDRRRYSDVGTGGSNILLGTYLTIYLFTYLSILIDFGTGASNTILVEKIRGTLTFFFNLSENM